MTLKSDLIAAKGLIDTPDKWSGERVYPGSILHALALSMGDGHDYTTAKIALTKAMSPRPNPPFDTYYAITEFGKAHSHADVMALFDRAIEAAS